MSAALKENEILILVADHITTPKDIRFEVNTKRKFNSSMKRLSLAGVCRFDSKANDLLQVVDLLIGCVTYDVKVSARLLKGSPHKMELVNYLKEKLGADTFANGFKNYNFNAFVEREVV